MRCLIIIDNFQNCPVIAAYMSARNIVNYSLVPIEEVSNWLDIATPNKVLVYASTKDCLGQKIPQLQNLNIDCAGLVLDKNYSSTKYTCFDETNSRTDIINWLKGDAYAEQREKYLVIKMGDAYRKVEKLEILFAKSDGKYISIRIGDRTYSIRTSLKSFHNILPNNFIRIHASYIINKSKIDIIDVGKQEVNIETHSIPYSRQYKSSLFKNFDFY